MSDAPRVAVVGGGIFGTSVALRLHGAGLDVTVLERQATILNGASHNNQNRLHLGFHYPRDMQTARQCALGFQRFVAEFPGCVWRGFPNAYFVAKSGSLTSTAAYLAFCAELGANFTRIDPSDFPIQVEDVESAILCEEAVYDSGMLRDAITERLQRASIAVRTGAQVERVSRAAGSYRLDLVGGEGASFAAVVNCSYADINRLTRQLGHAVQERQYEYTVVPIVEIDLPRAGVTVMDGRFMTLLPFGRSSRFLLYHVDHTVVASAVAESLDRNWLDPGTAPFARMSGADRAGFVSRIVADSARFVPAIRGARVVGFLEGPRMVLARRDDTDARPSIVSAHEPGYLTVLAGKIDHAVAIADEVADRLCATRQGAPDPPSVTDGQAPSPT